MLGPCWTSPRGSRMRDRQFGTTGLRVSPLGLGCNNFGSRLDPAAARSIAHAALDAGITVFDTADIYGLRGGSESILGEALGARRKDVVLVTKFGLPMDDEGQIKGGSARYIATAIEETLRALDSLIAQGKVRYIGCSNMSASQIVEAQRISQANGLHRFIACQDQYNLLSRQIEAEIIPAVEAHRLALLPYFPLASGMLTGKYAFGAPIPAGSRMSYQRYSDRFLNDENFRVVESLRAFCANRGRSLLELAFVWLLSKPFVGCVIAGASSPEQIYQNAAAIDWQLDAAEMVEVDRLTSKHKAPSFKTSQ